MCERGRREKTDDFAGERVEIVGPGELVERAEGVYGELQSGKRLVKHRRVTVRHSARPRSKRLGWAEVPMVPIPAAGKKAKGKSSAKLGRCRVRACPSVGKRSGAQEALDKSPTNRLGDFFIIKCDP